jgi:hypothetical protein
MAMQVWIVEGAHHFTPGLIVKVCATQDLAEQEAASLVNIIRKEADLKDDAWVKDWPLKLEEAQEILNEVHGHLEDEYSTPYVDISGPHGVIGTGDENAPS